MPARRALMTLIFALFALTALVPSGGSAPASAATLAPLRRAPDPASVIAGQYVVIYRAGHAATVEDSRALAEQSDGRLLYTYAHALHGFAVAGVSAQGLSHLRADPSVAYVEQDHWFIPPARASAPQGGSRAWLPLIARAPEEGAPTPTPSATLPASATPSITPSATASATPSATATVTATPSATATSTPSVTASPTATSSPSPTPTATIVIQQDATWGLDRTDQRFLPLNTTYTYSRDGQGTHAYIVDSGIRATHSEFSGRMGAGFDAVDNDNNPDDCIGHGTHVAGTVGGTVYGIAKGVTLHGVRVLNCGGGGTLAGILAGIDWVSANAELPAVVNMSLGGPVNGTIDNAVQALIDQGLPVIAAAGNSNVDACAHTPAHIPDVITVGATDMQDVRSDFSNWGACLDLFAPGSAIESAWHTSNSATHTIDGTSHAAPHVAGVAILWLSLNPGGTPAEVAAFILGSATPDLVGDPQGSPNLLLFSLYGSALR